MLSWKKKQQQQQTLTNKQIRSLMKPELISKFQFDSQALKRQTGG